MKATSVSFSLDICMMQVQNAEKDIDHQTNLFPDNRSEKRPENGRRVFIQYRQICSLPHKLPYICKYIFSILPLYPH